MSKIQVKNVYKIFGPRAEEAMALIRQGRSKAEVLSATGCVVGVNDLSLSIEAGKSSSSWGCPARENPPWCATSTA